MAKKKFGDAGPSEAALIRTVTGAPVVADAAPWADATYLPDDAVLTPGWMSGMFFVRFTGGTSPKVTVQLLHRAKVTGGSEGWVAMPAVSTFELADGEGAVLDVMSRDVYPVITNVVGAPTQVDIYAAGWRAYRSDSPRGS